MTFGKDFNAEQRAAFDAMAAERGSGMDASLLNQDRSIGNVDGTDYYNAIRDEAIKPNNILNGYLGIQEIPNLMANGSSTRGSRGLDTSSNMMASGSTNNRGVNTSLSNSIGRDVASGMGDGLNDVMRMTENIQSKYGNPNDRTVDQIRSNYNVDNAENAFQGMDNNRGLLQRTGDALVPDFYQPSSGVMMNLNRLLGGSDVTDQQIANHLDKQRFTPTSGNPHDRSNVAYNNQNIINNSLSDARNGYHIASGKDYGSMTQGDLPGGGLAATLGALAYQQVDGIADSSLFDSFKKDKDGVRGKSNFSNPFGTFGYNAFLQSADNIEGLRQSGNAPFLDTAYKIGQRIKTPSMEDFIPKGLLNRQPNEDAIRIAKQKEAGTFQPGKKTQAYEDKPVAVAKPKVKVNYNRNTPAPTQKKQSRAGAGAAKAKVTRTTGSRGGRGNVAKKRRLTGGR